MGLKTLKRLREDLGGMVSAGGGALPVNNISTGNIAGANGDPPVRRKKPVVMRRAIKKIKEALS